MIIKIIIAVVSAVLLLFGVYCIRDANKGGDFGQIYSWAAGVVSVTFGIGFLLFLTLIHYLGKLE